MRLCTLWLIQGNAFFLVFFFGEAELLLGYVTLLLLWHPSASPNCRNRAPVLYGV